MKECTKKKIKIQSSAVALTEKKKVKGAIKVNWKELTHLTIITNFRLLSGVFVLSINQVLYD